jgi:CheY-like chemotaxis protein
MFKGKVILVVDDEADLREILRDELIFEGAEVFEAANGREAMQQLSNRHFDAVLSDIRMPGGDGATLAREIRAKHPSQPVIVLITGFADLHSEEAFGLGADGYVTKPFHLEELKMNLRRLLKEPKDRWTDPVVQKPQRQIPVNQSFAEMARSGRLKLGRGGFFLRIDPEHNRMGDVIDVQFPDHSVIRAMVRWVRSDAQESPSPGLGLEFLQVPPQIQSSIQNQFPNLEKEKSYIPRS